MISQWHWISVGGPMAASTMQVHRACGAVIADPARHAKVCTAPDWEEPTSESTIRDWMQDGTVR